MKLLLCTKCQDIFKLQNEERSCVCGSISGKYLNNSEAIYSGDCAIPIGFSNNSLVSALRLQSTNGFGTPFTAFVIPENCRTIKKVEV